MNQGIAPWLQYPKLSLSDNYYQNESLAADIIVIGAGIAGASAAFEMAEAGFKVLVLEREERPATAGSGNVQGMLYLKLSPHLTYQNDLIIQGFEKTRSLLQLLTARGLLQKGLDWDDPGLLQLAYTQKQAENQKKLAEIYPKTLLYSVDQESASTLAGINLTSGGLFYPQSGWLSPVALVNALLDHPNITLQTQSKVLALREVKRDEMRSVAPLWAVDIVGANMGANIGADVNPDVYTAGITGRSTIKGKVIVLAMADQVASLELCESIPFTVVRGQTTTVQSKSALKVVVSGEGYVAPSKMIDGVAHTTFGATFHRDQAVSAPTMAEHIENIEMLRLNSPSLVDELGLTEIGFEGAVEEGKCDNFNVHLHEYLQGRVATRASAMGSLPIVGPIAERATFLDAFKEIRLDAKAVPDIPIPWAHGIYLSTAHGSRGMVTAPISAEILRRYILDTINYDDLNLTDLKRDDLNHAHNAHDNLTPQLLAAIHPNRFFYRELRFNQ